MGQVSPSRRSPMRLRVAASLVFGAGLLGLCSLPAPAEIFRWVDEQGTIHFTDELSNIPPDRRGKARMPAREGPVTIPAPPGATAAPPAPAAQPGSGDAGETVDAVDPVTDAEALRAKITAKEQLMESVERKRSLATNPLRNRIVPPADMELYRKYQAELPGDRERLKELESRIDALSR